MARRSLASDEPHRRRRCNRAVASVGPCAPPRMTAVTSSRHGTGRLHGRHRSGSPIRRRTNPLPSMRSSALGTAHLRLRVNTITRLTWTVAATGRHRDSCFRLQSGVDRDRQQALGRCRWRRKPGVRSALSQSAKAKARRPVCLFDRADGTRVAVSNGSDSCAGSGRAPRSVGTTESAAFSPEQQYQAFGSQPLMHDRRFGDVPAFGDKHGYGEMLGSQMARTPLEARARTAMSP